MENHLNIGFMNNPETNLLDEINYAKQYNFNFIDLNPDNQIIKNSGYDINILKKHLSENNLKIIGHTSWWLPFNNPLVKIQKATTEVLIDYLEFFHSLGANKMNVHLLPPISKHFDNNDIVSSYCNILNPLLTKAKNLNMNIMIENLDGSKKQQETIEILLSKLPDLKLHLDIGHCNLKSDRGIRIFIEKFHKKIIHLHLSDNDGKRDLHLPIGAGNINWIDTISLIKKFNINTTITLEVFSNDRGYLIESRKKLIKMWSY